MRFNKWGLRKSQESQLGDCPVAGRRVATARTLAQRPRLILADEFLSELDEENFDYGFGKCDKLHQRK